MLGHPVWPGPVAGTEYCCGYWSLGTQSGEVPLRTLVLTLIPWDRAVASTYGLNDDPTCSLLLSAMSTLQKIRSQRLCGSE